MSHNLNTISFKTAGTYTDAEWGCWMEWTTCSQTCSGPGHRQRERICIPGTENHGSKVIDCPGTAVEEDLTCGSIPCPSDSYCPPEYQYSERYEKFH